MNAPEPSAAEVPSPLATPYRHHPGLVLEMPPGGVLLVNGAQISFRDRTKIVLSNEAGHVNFLHGRQVMRPEEATTPLRVLYLAMQAAYAGEDCGDCDAELRILAALRNDLGRQPATVRAQLKSVEGLVELGSWWPAMKIVLGLIRAEEATSLTSTGANA